MRMGVGVFINVNGKNWNSCVIFLQHLHIGHSYDCFSPLHCILDLLGN